MTDEESKTWVWNFFGEKYYIDQSVIEWLAGKEENNVSTERENRSEQAEHRQHTTESS